MINLFKRKLIAATTILVCISGCSSMPKPNFKSMAEEYQNTIEQYNFNNILLNVVRGSEGLPMSFLDIPNIIGTGTFSASLSSSWGQPNIVPGLFNAVQSLTMTPSVTTGNTFNYTQSSLDNAVFQTGFNRKISLATINNFASHISNDLLLYLFFQSVTIARPDGRLEKYINSPYSQSPFDFNDIVDFFVRNNLRTQIINFETPIGGKISESQVARILPTILDFNRNARLAGRNAENLRLEFRPANNGQSEHYRLMQMNQTLSLCFGDSPTDRQIINEFGESYLCAKARSNNIEKAQSTGISDATDTIKDKSSLSFEFRSNGDIYRYLGEILRIQIERPDLKVKINAQIRMNAVGWSTTPTIQDAVPILVVKKNQNIDNPLATVNYRGDTYQIPSKDNGHSHSVINVMANLLNLSKVNGAIPISPAVIVR